MPDTPSLSTLLVIIDIFNVNIVKLLYLFSMRKLWNAVNLHTITCYKSVKKRMLI